MSKLALTLACWDYDRTRALTDGRVQVDGIDLTCLSLPVEETFFRMLRHQEFDVAEMSLSSYVMSLFRPERPFVAIPVFPSRVFRHSSIYVNAATGISEPGHLAGRRVGNPEYQMTANVWIRGILAEDYGVPVNSVTYCTGGEEEPGRPEKLPLNLPADIRVERIGPRQTLSAMLATGEIDALYTARTPSCFGHGDDRVRRLFPDFVPIERDYFRRTRIFPIMHTVVIRRAVYERSPWIAQSLHKAFSAAQQATYRDLRETAALKAMLPWLVSHIEETRREMGEDFWPYGYERNRDVLATFLRYSHEQGLAKRRLEPHELFAPETLESFTI
ncbi:MAG: ABC transporter substrate-binding protein [Acidobacteria bacterium]|nr:ABC transporter substrate-binding protein [Acidobacteriota bacterium]